MEPSTEAVARRFNMDLQRNLHDIEASAKIFMKHHSFDNRLVKRDLRKIIDSGRKMSQNDLVVWESKRANIKEKFEDILNSMTPIPTSASIVKLPNLVTSSNDAKTNSISPTNSFALPPLNVERESFPCNKKPIYKRSDFPGPKQNSKWKVLSKVILNNTAICASNYLQNKENNTKASDVEDNDADSVDLGLPSDADHGLLANDTATGDDYNLSRRKNVYFNRRASVFHPDGETEILSKRPPMSNQGNPTRRYSVAYSDAHTSRNLGRRNTIANLGSETVDRPNRRTSLAGVGIAECGNLSRRTSFARTLKTLSSNFRKPGSDAKSDIKIQHLAHRWRRLFQNSSTNIEAIHSTQKRFMTSDQAVRTFISMLRERRKKSDVLENEHTLLYLRECRYLRHYTPVYK